MEDSPSGLWRSLGKRVGSNPSRVQIPYPPLVFQLRQELIQIKSLRTILRIISENFFQLFGLKLILLNEHPRNAIYKNHPSSQIANFSEIVEVFLGNKNKGFFIEVGGYDGKTFGCTFGLAKKKWQGLYIEPVPKHVALIKKNHKMNKNIKVIEKAVGSKSGKINLHLNGPLTAISNAKSKNTISVQMETLSKILIENKVPRFFDVLVLDTEGFEKEILKNFNLIYWKPKLIVIELHDTNKKNKKLQQDSLNLYISLLKKGYVTIYKDWINTVLIDKKLLKCGGGGI